MSRVIIVGSLLKDRKRARQGTRIDLLKHSFIQIHPEGGTIVQPPQASELAPRWDPDTTATLQLEWWLKHELQIHDTCWTFSTGARKDHEIAEFIPQIVEAKYFSQRKAQDIFYHSQKQLILPTTISIILLSFWIVFRSVSEWLMMWHQWVKEKERERTERMRKWW